MKNSKRSPVPYKTTMNFAPRRGFISPVTAAVIAMALILGALVFAKFGIADPLAARNAARLELEKKQEQLAALNARLEAYDALALEYGRYSESWLESGETGMVSRMEVLALVEEKIAGGATVEDLAVNGNVLTLNICGITLEQAGAMFQSLEESPLVEATTVYNAVADEAREARIFMGITLKKEVP